MEYFHVLNLDREPFSTSPDPAFFYHSRQHVQCLQKLELSLRLRRGLNVVVGEVGTGKTTLCRQLIRQFGEEPEIETHLVLDPDFPDPKVFLAAIGDMIAGPAPPDPQPEWQVKERIKAALFEKGVKQGKTVILIIDEGQKLHPGGLETLRELLNYETNEAKLLQIVIFAQTEFDAVLAVHANFADRISLDYRLGPLGFGDTRRMIRHRLARSGGEEGRRCLFSPFAIWAIYRATGGYPRKIIHLCHKAVLAVIVQNRRRVTRALVRSCARRAPERTKLQPGRAMVYGAALALAAVAAIGTYGLDPAQWSIGQPPLPLPNKVLTLKIAKPESPSEAGAAVVAPAPEAVVPPASETSAPKPSAPPVMAPSDPIPSRPAEASVPAAPRLLGEAAPGRKETLSWMMVKIYGRYSNDLLGKVVRENPQIGNPSNIPVGRAIRFPAIAPDAFEPDTGGCWVQLGEYTELDQALRATRGLSTGVPSARLVPWWTPDTGIRFTVVLWDWFANEIEALHRIETLPEPLAGQARVLSGWRQGAVFFADPRPVR